MKNDKNQDDFEKKLNALENYNSTKKNYVKQVEKKTFDTFNPLFDTKALSFDQRNFASSKHGPLVNYDLSDPKVRVC